MKKSEQWARLHLRWGRLFSDRYERVVLDEVDGHNLYDSFREVAARRRTLIVEVEAASDVVDELGHAMRWFLPRVRDAKLDVTPLRRLLGWLEDWTPNAVDYSDGIELAAEARYVIDECVAVMGASLDDPEAAEGLDFGSAEQNRLRIMVVLAKDGGPLTRVEIEDRITPGYQLSKSSFLRYVDVLERRGWLAKEGNEVNRAYRVTESGLHQRTASPQS